MTVVYGLVFLCFLVFFHETGHFLLAKFFKVKVESFSIGIGPVLLHRNIKGTDYRLSLFPLGGYCGMKGEKDFSAALESGSSSIIADKDSLYGIAPLKRVLIIFAGPLFNFIFAVIAMTVVGMLGSEYYAPSAKIILADEIYPEVHSAARDAGMLTGDIIKTINGNRVNDFSDIFSYVSVCPDEDIVVTVERNEELLDFKVHTDFDKDQGIGKIGVSSSLDSVDKRIVEPLKFFPAFFYGIKETCRLVFISFKTMKIIFMGTNLTKTVSGPARITTMLGNTVQTGFSEGAKTGFCYTLNFMALISISLFIINILPVPILDGGLILFSLIEFFTKKQISPKIQYYVQFIGLAFIGFLIVVGLFGDIQYFISVAGSK
ncbi:MAG: site-2 protease family protein [Treponema sp.]|nr:site-2 protease family protein [Treponema sp.]